MKIPDFFSKIGWAATEIFKKIPDFVKRIGLVLLVVLLLIILFAWLCGLDIANPGIPSSIITIFKPLMDAKPQLQYISDLTAFIGVILAIAVPLGIDIIQKVSQFYAGSRTIRERLQNEWQMEWMVPVYLVTVLSSLTSRFFFIDTPAYPDFQRAVSYVLLLLLFTGLIIFAWYLNRLYVYVLNQKELKREIEDGMIATIGKTQKKPQYLNLVEAYGDILVAEARNANLKTLLDESLPFLEARIKQIIPKGDLENAEKFILSDEFFEVFNRGRLRQPGKSSIRQSNATQQAASDDDIENKITDYEQEAKMRLSFDPDRYMLVYLSTIQQIIRIYKEGLDTKNDELTTKAVYSLIRILSYFSSEEGRGFYIELLLRRLGAIARQSATANDISMYASTSQWYTTVAFNKYETEKFHLDYLTIFDRALYANLKFIVDNNYKQMFTSFIGYLVDGLHEPMHTKTVWDLGHMPLRRNFQKLQARGKAERIEDVTKQLVNSIKSVDTIDQVRNWQNKLLELKKLVRPLLEKDDKQKADALTVELANDIEEIYKYANLREFIFSLGAYCMFKKRYDFVKEIFDYKQPDDSDASWGGSDIQPETVSGVVNFYYKQGASRRDFNFWEGHHGSVIYTKRYFICLLTRAIARNPTDSVQLDHLTPTRLSDITYSIEGLKQIAMDLSSDEEVLSSMSISKDLITNNVIPLLDNLNAQAKMLLNSIESNRDISSLKVKNFKNDVIKAFDREAYIRSILNNYQKIIDESNLKYKGKALRYGISRIDEKAVFFDEWYVSYGNWGETYGSELARSENVSLYQEIKDRCNRSGAIDTIEKAARRCTHPVIFAPSSALFKYEDSGKFTPKWHTNDNKLPESEWEGFAGFYNVKGNRIPVFEISYFPGTESEVIVLDINKIPNLRILSPLSNSDSASDRKGSLSINVKAFSSDSALMQDFILNPPAWLKVVGDKDAQRTHLMSKVLIQIHERFEFSKKSTKIGHIINNGT